MNRFRFNWADREAQGAQLRPESTTPQPIAPTQVAMEMSVPTDLQRYSREEQEFIQAVRTRLLEEPTVSSGQVEQDVILMRARIATIAQHVIDESERVVSEREISHLVHLAYAEILGLGPIEPFLEDETVTEIMVNGPSQVWVERGGKLHKTTVRFQNDEHVRRIITRIIAPLGRRCDESSPMVDARLPDGSRVNAIVPPLCLNGPSLTIRKFSRTPLTGADLVARGAVSMELLEFLRACVLGSINTVVAGGTGTGKTTMLNVLSSFIPSDERIITIENAAELRLQQEHVMTLEARPANVEGKGEISIRDLVVNALRMRPDRIIIGECRSGEAMDMLQAMNTGHDGSMTTLHANTPRDALHRMETMALMSGLELPQRAIREQIASAIQLVIQIERFQDGSRRVSRICEVTGMEHDIIALSDLFVFKSQGMQDGRVVGTMQPTGLRPKFITRLHERNIALSPQIFGYSVPRNDGRAGRDA